MKKKCKSSFLKLRTYCENNGFVGWDVGDGAGSRLLTGTPLNKSPFCRFAFLQLTGHRIAYVNLRPLLWIPKRYNAKAIALFLNGYCNLYDLSINGVDVDISKDESLTRINKLAELLIRLKSEGYHGAGWGYPFGWQHRSGEYFPPDTPTIVATSFAVEALFHAYDIGSDERYKQTALSSAEFVLRDLRRTNHAGGYFLSYAPMKGNDTVINASLLGAKLLAQCYRYSGNKEYLTQARIIAATAVACQHADGSWGYGLGAQQRWIDNFHTGYNLDALQTYQQMTGDDSFDEQIEKGTAFMLAHHFDAACRPKYYHDKQYPIDIHCCGELFVVLHKCGVFEQHYALADSVMAWTLKHMQHPKKGYFYFQKWKHFTNKAPLMRWSQAFMFNAMTCYLKSKNRVK